MGETPLTPQWELGEGRRTGPGGSQGPEAGLELSGTPPPAPGLPAGSNSSQGTSRAWHVDEVSEVSQGRGRLTKKQASIRARGGSESDFDPTACGSQGPCPPPTGRPVTRPRGLDAALQPSRPCLSRSCQLVWEPAPESQVPAPHAEGSGDSTDTHSPARPPCGRSPQAVRAAEAARHRISPSALCWAPYVTRPSPGLESPLLVSGGRSALVSQPAPCRGCAWRHREVGSVTPRTRPPRGTPEVPQPPA